jgi:hypothetical protein
MSTGTLQHRLRQQADFCRGAGSRLTADLLDGAAGDLDTGGPVAELLLPLADDPEGSVAGLRFAGALHRLVLERRAPALAVHYPSVGGTLGDLWPVARRTVAEHLDELHELVRRPVQTNEVGRSSALLGGLLHVSARTSLPVRLLEVGASGGLNLQVDRFRHEVTESVVLGDPASPVVLAEPWQGALPPYDAPLEVVERSGCDPAPLDPARTEDRLTLTSYVWADQPERFERLRAALEVAAAHPVVVERAGAADFTARELSPRAGVATVLWHSIVLQYVPPAERELLLGRLDAAGERATHAAPLAHLALEPVPDVSGHFQLGLTTWPGGVHEVLADCHGHGPPVVWR